MRAFLPALLATAILASSVPAQPTGSPLAQARAEQHAAEVRVAQLERAAAAARTEAQRLHAQQAAAAQAIEAAEARITAAQLTLDATDAETASAKRTLIAEQQPLSSLLAGLAIMGQRPPLLAMTDRAGADEMVQVRILLDSTMPVIRRRTAAVTQRLSAIDRLRAQAVAARNELKLSQRDLASKRQRFAQLERGALQSAAAAGGQALSAGDVALAAGEDLAQLSFEARRSRAAEGIAASLLNSSLPARPGTASSPDALSLRSYRLPVDGAVQVGLGAISESGVRARGVTIASPRGAQLIAPANGVVRFAGPFRDYDGVLIIDHGQGWISVIVNVAPTVAQGQRVTAGAPVGRALGPVEVELSRNGQRLSPAIIAGSSGKLSNSGEGD
jgi:septal ring factor EnvC (AmiA/AmiB activator)